MSRIVAALAAVALLLTGCASAPDESKTVTFAVAGDSLTAWTNETFPNPSGEFDPTTWTHWTISPTMQLVGGYARAFATGAAIADNIIPVDADVLVVMVGANDVGVNQIGTVRTSIEQIVERAGVDTVLVSALPPSNGFTALTDTFNAALTALAAENDWAFVDPWVEVRDDGRWVDGMTADDTHPTAEGAELAGAAISAAIRELVG